MISMNLELRNPSWRIFVTMKRSTFSPDGFCESAGIEEPNARIRINKYETAAFVDTVFVLTECSFRTQHGHDWTARRPCRNSEVNVRRDSSTDVLLSR